VKKEAKQFLDLTGSSVPQEDDEHEAEQESANDDHPTDDLETQAPESQVNSPDTSGETPTPGDEPPTEPVRTDVDDLVDEVMGTEPSPRRLDLDLDDVPFSIRQSRLREQPSTEAPPEDDPSSKRARVDEAPTAFWALASDEPVVEASFAMDKKDMGLFIDKPGDFVLAAMHAKRAEFSMKPASDEMKKKMQGAKLTEVNNWLSNQVCIAVHRSEIGDRVPMRMRWVLTVKSDGTAKARLVVLGFQDHRLGKMPTEAPTVSVRGRNLALQLMANRGFKMRKGDVKAAFLQGQATQGVDNVFVEPCAELREGDQAAESSLRAFQCS